MLGVIIGEDHAFFGDSVDIRGAIAHQAHGVGTDIGLTDIIAPDDQDIGLFVLGIGRYGHH